MGDDERKGLHTMARARKSARGTAAEVLREIQDNKDRRDAEARVRAEREDAALAEYAAAVAAPRDAWARAEKRKQQLQAEIAKAEAAAREAAEQHEPAQGAALRQLQELGQSADDIARVVGISAKRVRALIKKADGGSAGGDGHARPVDRPAEPQSAEVASATEPAPTTST